MILVHILFLRIRLLCKCNQNNYSMYSDVYWILNVLDHLVLRRDCSKVQPNVFIKRRENLRNTISDASFILICHSKHES